MFDSPSWPHALDEFSEGSCNLSFHAEGILLIDVFDVVVVREVFHDGRGVGQALLQNIEISQKTIPKDSWYK